MAQEDSTEHRRLQALRLYELLDTGSEESFNNLTQLAALICDVPISLVSLLDEDRQWFKSNHGLDATETPRSQAFCHYAIQQHSTFVVPDATRDPLFSENPLVSGPPYIRYYAGVSLEVSGGHKLGTLCAIDTVPRQLSELQLTALRKIADSVVHLIELRLKAHRLMKLEALLPVCSWCKSVCTIENEWISITDYVSQNAEVTHGMCPECFEKHSKDIN